MSSVSLGLKTIFKNRWVKILALSLSVLAVVGVTCSLLLPSDKGNSDDILKENKITVTNCDNVDYIYAGNGGKSSNFKLDPYLKRTGYASYSFFSNGASNEGQAFCYSIVKMPVENILSMQRLCFDFYVSDAAQLNGKQMTIELGSSVWTDDFEIEHFYTFKDLKNGWNHLEIPLNIVASKSQGFSHQGKNTFNGEEWCRLKMFNKDVYEVTNLTVAFDNIYFIKK